MPQSKYITLTDPSLPERRRQLAYYEWGDSNNPVTVMCVHGLSRNGRDFDFLAQALSNRYRVICPDMAGRGKSDWLSNAADYNYITHVNDCKALLESLHLQRVFWVGTSMGGIIGMMMAIDPNYTIANLVLNDIGSLVSAEGLVRILNFVGTVSTFPNAEIAMDQLKGYLAPFGIKDEAQWQYLFEVSFNPLPDGSYALAYDPGISKSFKEAALKINKIEDVDLSALWNAVKAPTLILRGKESDILSEATAKAMCQRTIPTKLVEFDGVGHAPALLDPAQITVICDWFAQFS